MIEKEDSPERRELAQDLAKVTMGVMDLADLNHIFRKNGGEILQREKDGLTIFTVFELKPKRRQIDTFVFGSDLEDFHGLDESGPSSGISGTFGTFGNFREAQ